MKRYLIIDCISQLPEGKDLAKMLTHLAGTEASIDYLPVQSIKRRKGYKLLRTINRFIQRHVYKERGKYTFPHNTGLIKRTIQQFKPTHIIWMGLSFRYVSMPALAKLKHTLGFKSILIDIDINTLMNNMNELWYYLNKEVPRHDRILMVSKKMSEYFQSIQQQKITYFPAFAIPETQIPPQAKEMNVLFYGAPSARRLVLLNSIAHHQVAIVGKDWSRPQKHEDVPSLLHPKLRQHLIKGSAWQQDLARLIHRSKIILNISKGIWFSIESGITVRTYQVLAHGGFLLTEYCHELEETLTPGKDVETYRDIEELNDKIAFYLKHDEARNKIAQQGYETFLKYHTTEKRAAQLLTTLETL